MGAIPVFARIPLAPAGVGIYDMWLDLLAKETLLNANRFSFNFMVVLGLCRGLRTDWGVHLMDYALYGMKAIPQIGKWRLGR